MLIKIRPMRLLLLLVLGAATSVAVAWACAVAGRSTDSNGVAVRFAHTQAGTVQYFEWSRFGMLYVIVTPELLTPEFRANAKTPQVPRPLPAWADDPLPHDTGQLPMQGRFGCGWPLICLTAGWELESALSKRLPQPWGSFTPLPDPSLRPDMIYSLYRDKIPYHPIWPGLLANTALFAAAWSVLLFAPPAALRALRRRRGHCPRCNYDLTTLASHTPCPECGAPRGAAT